MTITGRSLTDPETEATDLFLQLLEEPGVGNKDQAVLYALTTMPDRWVTDEFVQWLSEGRMTKQANRILLVKHLDEDTHPLTREL